MAEVWLKQNTRALALGMSLPGLATLCLLVWLSGLIAPAPEGWLKIGVLLIAGGGILLLAALAWQTREPRLAYRDGEMLVNLRAGAPIRVPIEIVEGFLLGQAPTLLPGKQNARAESRTVVIRLAEKAEEWSHLTVKPALGKWCDGYITIRGIWCEPLTVDLVNRLNARLPEVQRAYREQQVAG